MFRSLLFIPGNNPSMIQNADVFESDGIIFDLEDSVALSEKDNARYLIGNYLGEGQSHPSLVVLRVNPVDTEFFEKDLQLLKTGKIDYILLPKSSVDSLSVLDEKLSVIEAENKLPVTKVLALVESAKSVIEVFKIAKHQRVEGILLGAEDLCNDLEISRTNNGSEIQFARSRVIYACAANNIISIDTPNTSVNDESLLKQDCLNARSLGMKSKTAIHPNQLEIINEIFSPTRDEIKWAEQVVKARDENIDKGAFSLNGKMIDKPLISKAEKIIEKAKQFKMK
ncbi:MAG TPA: CoA ester lyase [Bacillota bacterium]|nr:CoA ester lyase [Bacillota bacterium]